MSGTISAIVPTYNRANYLTEALAALTSQTRAVDEIIVWDDGSTDATQSVVHGAKGPIQYFRSENGGKSRALNSAIKKAQGDYIWICDDDDIALPRAAEILAAPLDTDPGLGISGGGYRRFRDDAETGTRIESGAGYWPDLTQGTVLRHLLEDIFVFQNATLVRRACYDAIAPFREDLPRSIDYDMIVRLAARFPMQVTEEVVFLQRKHDGARGPVAARHAAAQSDAVWKEADLAVFAPFRESLPLTLYEAMFDCPDAQSARRAALLQRGCICARRTDWATALEDFAAAAELHPRATLSRTEYAICRRATAGKHGWAEIATPEVRAELARLARTSAAGRGIARGLLRGLVWRARVALKEQDLVALRQLAQTFAQIGAPAAFGSGRPLPDQIERRHLPPEAYESME